MKRRRIIDRFKTDFQNAVSEQEGLWIKEGGPTDEQWDAYVKKLKDSCGMDKLREVYQNAYDRYMAARQSNKKFQEHVPECRKMGGCWYVKSDFA